MDTVNSKKIRMAIFDVAGTTAQDGGLVVDAFQSAMESMGTALGTPEMERMTEYVNATMGERKIDVFMHLCDGNTERANTAHDRFIESYISLVNAGKLQEFEGITNLFDQLRESGVAVAITTGFPRDILQTIIDALKWAPHIDFSVASSEVAMGRPAPDMIIRAIELYNKGYTANIAAEDTAVIGDTEADIKAGVSAGASIVAGVTSGAHNAEQLLRAGATHILIGAVQLLNIC